MRPAPKPENETKRLEALQSLNILDTLPEADFDQITYLASQICGTPIALISLVAGDRQWFKSKVGLGASETHRDLAFCAHAILGNDVFIVENSSLDQRFSDNPLSTGAPHVQFYAGAPLLSPNGYPIGTVCVIDSQPRKLEPEKIASLKCLSQQVTRLLELRTQVENQKKTEASLRFKNKALETIVEGVVLQDASGTIVDFNPAALEVLNLSAEQLMGKTSTDASWKAIKEDGSEFPGHEHPAMICLKTGAPQKNITMGIRSGRIDTRWIKINSVPIYPNGENIPNYAVTSFTDISKEILLNKQLQQRNNELRFLLDGLPHMIGLWDTNEINLQANSTYADYFDKDPSQIKGLHLRELLGEHLYKKNSPYIRKVLTGERVSFERNLTHRDGSIRSMLATYIPNFEGKKLISFLTVVMDVTELKMLERDQKDLQARLAETAKLSALGEMAAGVAHEINNPLAIIKGKSDILVRKIKEKSVCLDKVVKELNSIDSTVDRIANIVRALKTYSRDTQNDGFEEMSLHHIIEDTLELCRQRFNNANINIRLECDPKLRINCRPAQISQVIMNLLNNSFDAILHLKEKWIEVKAKGESGFIHLEITDSGKGIPNHIAARMKDPFFTTKDVGKGTGLGLSISTGIMESHGGTLNYQQGTPNTTFSLTFPESDISTNKKIA